jgi:hypothetical protein
MSERSATDVYTRHEERSVTINAPTEQVFAALDDHTRLSSHMSEPSWRMGGGSMETVVDAGRGQSIGSHIILQGRVFGVRLFVEEIVTVREPPNRKVWTTIGAPRLVVIGPYQMSFEVAPHAAGAQLRVAIDYDLPPSGVGRLLGWIFGGAYARWCVRRMTSDAARLFAA